MYAGLVAASACAMAKPGLVAVSAGAKYGDSRRSTPSMEQKTITLWIPGPRPKPSKYAAIGGVTTTPPMEVIGHDAFLLDKVCTKGVK